MRLKRIALSTTFATAAMFALAARPADAQAFRGTFAGPHGAVSVDVGRPFHRFAPFRHGFVPIRRFAPRRFAPFPRFGFAAFPRFRTRRVFVEFPFPHWVVRRVYAPYCGPYGY